MNSTGSLPAFFSVQDGYPAWCNERQYLIPAITGCITVFYYIVNSIIRSFTGIKAPVIGYRYFFEPAWIVGVRFGRGAGPMIREGYSKVIL